MAKREKAVLEEDARYLWSKYCGFLDLTMQQFKNIQEELLLEQLQMVATSPLGRRLLRGSKPTNVADFRRIAKLTKYGDYLPDLEDGNDASLPEPAYSWVHTTGARGDFKYIPYTLRAYEQVLDNMLGAIILSCATRKGDVKVRPGDKVLYNTLNSKRFHCIRLRATLTHGVFDHRWIGIFQTPSSSA